MGGGGAEPRSCREMGCSRSRCKVPSQLGVGKAGAGAPHALRVQLARAWDSQLGPEESGCWDPKSPRNLPSRPGPRAGHTRPESPANRNKLTMGANENEPGGRSVCVWGGLKSKCPEHLPGHPEVTLGPAVAMEVAGRVAGRREDGGD